jgi:hypothetical protein
MCNYLIITHTSFYPLSYSQNYTKYNPYLLLILKFNINETVLQFTHNSNLVKIVGVERKWRN